MVAVIAVFRDFGIHFFNNLHYNKDVVSRYILKQEIVAIVKKQHSAAAILDLIERCLDEAKAQDVVVIDLSGKSTIADYLIVASGTSQRQLGAIADRISQTVDHTLSIEGIPGCDWVCVDTGDVVVHLFKPETRGFYNLEKMWGAELPQPAEQAFTLQ